MTPDVAQNCRHDRRTIVGARWERDLTDNTTWRTQAVWDDKDIDQPTGATTARGSTPSFIVLSDGTRKGQLLHHQSTTYGGGFFKYEDTNSNGYNLTDTGQLGGYTSGAFGTITGVGFHLREELSLGERSTIVGGFGYEHTALSDTETLYTYTSSAAPTTAQYTADRTYNNFAPKVAEQYVMNVSATFIRLAAEKCGFEIYVVDEIPVRFRDIERVEARKSGGVIDETIQRADLSEKSGWISETFARSA